MRTILITLICASVTLAQQDPITKELQMQKIRSDHAAAGRAQKQAAMNSLAESYALMNRFFGWCKSTEDYARACKNWREYRTKKLYIQRNGAFAQTDVNPLAVIKDCNEQILKWNDPSKPFHWDAYKAADRKFWDSRKEDLFKSPETIQTWERNNGTVLHAAVALVEGDILTMIDMEGVQTRVNLLTLKKESRDRIKQQFSYANPTWIRNLQMGKDPIETIPQGIPKKRGRN